MRFIDLEFNKNYFILTREDFQKVCFPYAKIDYITCDSNAGRLRIEVKKQASFYRDYESVDALNRDALKLMAKGGTAV
jgi:hypothetical protein